MPTIKAALDQLSNYLPKGDVKYLLSNLLNQTTASLLIDLQKPLNPSQKKALEELVIELKTQKPLAQILGKKTVLDQEFIIEKNVLIPRPETELLIEEALKTQVDQILELGTGTGCIAITLAKHFPKAQVYSWDISKDAIICAQKNKAIQNVPNLTLIQNDFFKDSLVQDLLSNGKKSLLITNPPYIPTGDIPKLDKSVKNFEPHEALDGGKTGLDFYQKLQPIIKKYRPHFLAEFGIHQSQALKKLFHIQNPIIINDYASIPRILKIHPPAPPKFNKQANSYAKYATHQTKLGHELRETLKTQFPDFSPKKILDIGCAEGQGTCELQSQYPDAQITAIDAAEEMIKLSNPHPKITFKHANTEVYPFPENLDLIHSNATLQWINNLPALLKKCHASLAQNGILAITLYGPQTYQELAGLICNPLPASRFHSSPEVKEILNETFPNHTHTQTQTRVTYPDLLSLLKTIQKTGTAISSQKGLYTPRTLKKLESRYQSKFGSIIATHQAYILLAQK